MKHLLLVLFAIPLYTFSQVSYTVTVTKLKALADDCDGGVPIVCPNAPQDPVFNVWSNDAEANENTYCWKFNNDDDQEYGLWNDIQNVEIANEVNVITSYITFDMEGFESDALTAPTCSSALGDDEIIDREFVHLYDLSTIPQSTPFVDVLSLGGIYFMEIEVSWEDLAAGIQKIQNELSLVIAPNPSNGNFRIKLSDQSLNEFKITIVDIAGRVVYSDLINSNESLIDISTQDAGAYFVYVEAGGSTTTKTLILN